MTRACVPLLLGLVAGCAPAITEEPADEDASSSSSGLLPEPGSTTGDTGTDFDPASSTSSFGDESSSSTGSNDASESSTGQTATCSSPLIDADDRLDALASPMRGNPDALVTVVIWTGFGDPFSRNVQATLEDLLAGPLGDDVRVVAKQYPLPFQDPDEVMARAGLAAHALGSYWAFNDAMFALEGEIDASVIDAVATEVGLDLDAFHAAMLSPDVAEQLAADQTLFNQVGAAGTPSWVINGAFFVGAQPLEVFAEAAQEQLDAMSAAIDEGLTPCEAYASRLDAQLP
ncbi:MAG: DsbA family protein [Myxococcota bacterium]